MLREMRRNDIANAYSQMQTVKVYSNAIDESLAPPGWNADDMIKRTRIMQEYFAVPQTALPDVRHNQSRPTQSPIGEIRYTLPIHASGYEIMLKINIMIYEHRKRTLHAILTTGNSVEIAAYFETLMS